MSLKLRTPKRRPKLWERYLWLAMIPMLLVLAAIEPVGRQHHWIMMLLAFAAILGGTTYRIYLGIWIMRLRAESHAGGDIDRS